MKNHTYNLSLILGILVSIAACESQPTVRIIEVGSSSMALDEGIAKGGQCGAQSVCACGLSCLQGVCCTGPGDCQPAAPAVVKCASGQFRCDGNCVDLNTDSKHCGSCGQALRDGEICYAGVPTAVIACGTETYPLLSDQGITNGIKWFLNPVTIHAYKYIINQQIKVTSNGRILASRLLSNDSSGYKFKYQSLDSSSPVSINEMGFNLDFQVKPDTAAGTYRLPVKVTVQGTLPNLLPGNQDVRPIELSVVCQYDVVVPTWTCGNGIVEAGEGTCDAIQEPYIPGNGTPWTPPPPPPPPPCYFESCR